MSKLRQIIDPFCLNNIVMVSWEAEDTKRLLVNRYGKNYGEKIHNKQITEICLNRLYIISLAPLRCLTPLQVIYLNSNKISDLAPLSSLVNLRILYLHNNQISNLTPLRPLVNLKTLDLGSNKISNLTPLRPLVNLRTLFLNNNQIRDIASLSSLVNLENLIIDQFKIRYGPRNLQELQLIQKIRRYYWETWVKIKLRRYSQWVHEMKKWYLVEALYGKPEAYFRLKGIPLVS